MSEQNKAVAVLIETFRDCLHRGKQPTFSAGDLKYFIEALLAPPADQQGEPAGWANENALKELQERKSGTWPFIAPISSHKSPLDGITVALYRHAQPATAKVVLPEREILRDVIAAVIGGDAYDCTRVWSAWGVGTMSDDDFVPIVEQEERLYELVDACLDEVAKLNNQPS